LVEKNEHQRAGAGVSKLRAAKSITAFTCLRSSPSNQDIMSSRLAPASRFSKIVATGMRVPRSTQAPLTLPGTLSTAAHCDQSSAAIRLFQCPTFSRQTQWLRPSRFLVWHSDASGCPRLSPPMQSTPRCIGVPMLRSQNRPRIGRGDRDVARVRGAARSRQPVCGLVKLVVSGIVDRQFLSCLDEALRSKSEILMARHVWIFR